MHKSNCLLKELETMNDIKDFLPFHGDLFITLIRVFGFTIIAVMINDALYYDYGAYTPIIFFVSETYASIEMCCYVSNKSTGGKSKLTDIKALLVLGNIMITTIIIWIKALGLTHITKW